MNSVITCSHMTNCNDSPCPKIGFLLSTRGKRHEFATHVDNEIKPNDSIINILLVSLGVDSICHVTCKYGACGCVMLEIEKLDSHIPMHIVNSIGCNHCSLIFATKQYNWKMKYICGLVLPDRGSLKRFKIQMFYDKGCYGIRNCLLKIDRNLW